MSEIQGQFTRWCQFSSIFPGLDILVMWNRCVDLSAFTNFTGSFQVISKFLNIGVKILINFSIQKSFYTSVFPGHPGSSTCTFSRDGVWLACVKLQIYSFIHPMSICSLDVCITQSPSSVCTSIARTPPPFARNTYFSLRDNSYCDSRIRSCFRVLAEVCGPSLAFLSANSCKYVLLRVDSKSLLPL
jgi:hypothetical protein